MAKFDQAPVTRVRNGNIAKLLFANFSFLVYIMHGTVCHVRVSFILHAYVGRPPIVCWLETLHTTMVGGCAGITHFNILVVVIITTLNYKSFQSIR